MTSICIIFLVSVNHEKMSQMGWAFFRFEKRTFRDEPLNISGLLGMNHGWMEWNFWLLSRSAWQLNWGLGPHFPIPVEVVPFCHEHTARPWDGHFTIFFTFSPTHWKISGWHWSYWSSCFLTLKETEHQFEGPMSCWNRVASPPDFKSRPAGSSRLCQR